MMRFWQRVTALGGRAIHRRRGMTLIELVVGMTVIAIAAVGTSIAIFNAYGQLQRQRHRLIANHYLRSEVEFWQGRVHSALPTRTERIQRGPERTVIIDPRTPGEDSDDIIATVRRDPLRQRTMEYSGNRYFEIPVVIRYTEPTWAFGGQDADIEYWLVGYWMESVAVVEQ